MNKTAKLTILIAALMSLAAMAAVECGKDSGPIGPPGAGSGARFHHTRAEVAISHLPRLNEPFTLSGTFTALRDHADVELWLSGGSYLDGEDRWHGPMAEGEVRTLTATFAFVKEGNYSASARAWAPVPSGPQLDRARAISLNVNRDRGRLGHAARNVPVFSWGSGDAQTVDTGRPYLIETALALNTSDQPRIEFLRSWADVERLQAQGLLPSELRYRWRNLRPDLFSKTFLLVYWDALRPRRAI